jgi:NADPH-dependent curcumin reductase CurA
VTREVILAARPTGAPQESDFELREVEEREPGEGEVLVRNVFVSVDPYMRGRMSGIRTYVGPYDVGAPIDGAAVGRVVASRCDDLAEGDWVGSMLGWRESGVVEGNRLRKIDPSLAPPSSALGVLGMPGFTAWIGLVDIGRVQEGETIFVSGAAGAVGSAAAQIAKLKGLRVIGSAGSEEKVEWLRSLGVEAFDYKQTRAKEALADGIDVYFDNVGGEQLEAALTALRPFGRVIACGGISRYNDTRPEPGPRNMNFVVTKRLRIEGFIIIDHTERFGEFIREVGPWVAQGKVTYRETVLEGIENIPQAFAGLFRGDNTGKMLVRVGPDEDGA